MITEPKIEHRSVQPYVAIRTQVTMQELDSAIQRLRREVLTWIANRGIEPTGVPFLRNRVVDMEALLDIEVGVPVAHPESIDEHIIVGVLPEGNYASLLFTGWDKGIEANAVLLDWGNEQGLILDAWNTENGMAFGARLMFLLTDPDKVPDQAKWKTEVAIRLAS